MRGQEIIAVIRLGLGVAPATEPPFFLTLSQIAQPALPDNGFLMSGLVDTAVPRQRDPRRLQLRKSRQRNE